MRVMMVMRVTNVISKGSTGQGHARGHEEGGDTRSSPEKVQGLQGVAISASLLGWGSCLLWVMQVLSMATSG